MLRLTRVLRSSVKPAVDWVALAELVEGTPAKDDLVKFRKALDEFERLSENKVKATPINWDYYRRTIKTPGVVDAYEKWQRENPVPEPSRTVVKDIEAAFAPIEKAAKQAVDESKVVIAELEAELAELKNMKALDQMTPEELLEKNPWMAKKVVAELEARNWEPASL